MEANQLIKKYANKQFITKKIHMPSHHIDDYHSHPWHQIVFPFTGLLQSSIADKCVIVPHNAMLYIPANTVHKSIAVTDTQFLAIYLNPSNAIKYSDTAKSCLLTPFIKELIMLLFDNRLARQTAATLSNLLTVFNDQIAIADSYEIPLLIPSDRRLMSIFTQLQKQPDLKLTLQEYSTSTRSQKF